MNAQDHLKPRVSVHRAIQSLHNTYTYGNPLTAIGGQGAPTRCNYSIGLSPRRQHFDATRPAASGSLVVDVAVEVVPVVVNVLESVVVVVALLVQSNP